MLSHLTDRTHCIYCGVILTDTNRYPSDKRQGTRRCISCRRKSSTYKNNRKSVLSRRKKVKFEVLLHYTKILDSNATKPHCKCGFSDIRALSLDKIDGGHRKSKLPRGLDLYYKLRSEGYPKGWQTFCMNCQFIKRIENREDYFKYPQ